MVQSITSRISSIIPALGWLRGYRLSWLRGDVVAGITLAAYLMPAGIGDASLAGLPPEAGLYACLFSGMLFWLLTSAAIRHAITRWPPPSPSWWPRWRFSPGCSARVPS